MGLKVRASSRAGTGAVRSPAAKPRLLPPLATNKSCAFRFRFSQWKAGDAGHRTCGSSCCVMAPSCCPSRAASGPPPGCSSSGSSATSPSRPSTRSSRTLVTSEDSGTSHSHSGPEEVPPPWAAPPPSPSVVMPAARMRDKAWRWDAGECAACGPFERVDRKRLLRLVPCALGIPGHWQDSWESAVSQL